MSSNFYNSFELSSSKDIKNTQKVELNPNDDALRLFKDPQLENFCQKVKLLRDTWIKLWKNRLIPFPESPILSSRNIVKNFHNESVRILVHIKELEVCKFIKAFDEAMYDSAKYAELTRLRDNTLEVEFMCSVAENPSKIILHAFEAMKSKPHILNYINSNEISNYILRFKDSEEYLTLDFPLFNYLNYHKMSIDQNCIYLELINSKKQIFNELPLDNLSQIIYKYTLYFLTNNNEFYSKHDSCISTLKLLLNFSILFKTYFEYYDYAGNERFTKSINLLKSPFDDLKLNSMEKSIELFFNQMTNKLIMTRCLPLKRLEIVHTILSLFMEHLSFLCKSIRSFLTQKSYLLIKQILLVIDKQDHLTENIIINLCHELVSMLYIFFQSMKCSNHQLTLLSFASDFNYNDTFCAIPKSQHDTFCLTLHSLCNLTDNLTEKHLQVIFQVELCYCSRSISIPSTSSKQKKTNSISQLFIFEETIDIEFPINGLRPGMGIIFTLCSTDGVCFTKLLAGFIELFDHNQQPIFGDFLIGLVPGDFSRKMKTIGHGVDLYRLPETQPYLHISIPKILNKIVSDKPNSVLDTKFENLSPEKLQKEVNYLQKYILTRTYRKIPFDSALKIWKNRSTVLGLPSRSNLLLLVVSSGIISLAKDEELSQLLESQVSQKIHDLLLMLGPAFSNKTVRKFAIHQISQIDIETLKNYTTILATCLAYETNLWCNYMCMLIQRSWDSPIVAHKLFWSCKHLADHPFTTNNFFVFLSVLLGCFSKTQFEDIRTQIWLVDTLKSCGKYLQSISEKDIKNSLLKETVLNINNKLNSTLSLPTCPSLKIKKIIAEKCKVFSSASSPALICFENEYPCGQEIQVIFKVGDVLERDMITIHIFHILNKLWLMSGINLKMRIYDVTPTGEFDGFVDVVPNVTSLGEIHALSGMTGSFNPSSIIQWLSIQNPSKRAYENSIENFVLSCAGYCVATYLLGICDRHNDNILLTKAGYLLHIDFNKYLGDAQMFMGIKRDRAPFVLTPDMLAVISELNVSEGNGYQFFAMKCCSAFLIVRRNASLILNSFQLLLGANPEFNTYLEYMVNRLKLDISENDAFVEFYNDIEQSSQTIFTQFNFFIHNLAHRRKTKRISTEYSSKGLFKFCGAQDYFYPSSEIYIEKIIVVDHVNKKLSTRPNATYFIILIELSDKRIYHIYRSLDDLFELISKLEEIEGIPKISTPLYVRVQRDSQNYIKKYHLECAIHDMNMVLEFLLTSSTKNSPILYTWCHQFTDDNQLNSEQIDNEVNHLQPIIPKTKIKFENLNNNINLLVTQLQYIDTLNVTSDTEFYIQLTTSYSRQKITSKKKVLVTDCLFIYNFSIPIHDNLESSIIVLSFKTQSLLSSKVFGKISIPLKNIDYLSLEGTWFKIDPV